MATRDFTGYQDACGGAGSLAVRVPLSTVVSTTVHSTKYHPDPLDSVLGVESLAINFTLAGFVQFKLRRDLHSMPSLSIINAAIYLCRIPLPSHLPDDH